MGDDRRDCCDRDCARDCNDRCFQDDCCDNGGGGLNIIWILVIVYLLFCNNGGIGGGKGGGLFGGLF